MKSKPEQELWVDLSTTMGQRWDASRIEDMYKAGVADVTWAMDGVQGWTELKVANRPVRSTSLIDLSHLTGEQCLWLSRRDRYGDRTFLFLKIHGSGQPDMYYLIRGRFLVNGLWQKTEQDISAISCWKANWIDRPTLVMTMLQTCKKGLNGQ